MAAALTFVGCYPIDPAPWHLVEIEGHGIQPPLEVGRLHLRDEALPDSSNYQVPYDERLLDVGGTRQVIDEHTLFTDSSLLVGDFRMCFFLYLYADLPLQTPYGPIALSKRTPRPPRLDFVQFEQPW